MSKLNKIGDFYVDDVTYIEHLEKINGLLLEACKSMVNALNATGSRKIGLEIEHDQLINAIYKAERITR